MRVVEEQVPDKRFKKEADKRTKRITVTLTEAEYKQIMNAVAEAQQPGLSIDAATFCRIKLLKATGTK